MTQKPAHFVTRKFQDFQKLSARGYVCPICAEGFQDEPRLWTHAKTLHLQDLGISEGGDEAEKRRQFKSEAIERAQKSPRRAIRGLEQNRPKLSSNDDDSMKPNVGEELRSPSPSRPLSAPDSSLHHGKRIEGFENLTLNQEGTTAAISDCHLPSFNPLKRGAVGESDTLDASTDLALEHRTTSSRRTKALSSGPFVGKNKDPDFVREASHPSESIISRKHYSEQRLFDPNADNPNSSPVNRKSKQEPITSARRVYDSRAHVFRLRTIIDQQKKHRPKLILNKDQQNKSNEKYPEQLMNLENDPTVNEYEIDSETVPMDTDLDAEPEILLQPETRPISHEQLVVEVKGIYAGLVMVEAKCIDVDKKQSIAAQEKDPSRQIKLSNEQWQALIALHKTLLHEHHDFFLASQHPSASPALSRLAAKYSMPARMWRHGIHAFLEVLRHRLPESLDHMLAFIYIAFSMMALLYEAVPTFEDTWIECLGDLGRYRMAIEDADIRDREVWSGVARFWYSKAADKSPDVGRLYHHLAILARAYTLQQLSFYTRSLTCVTPFESARGSIMTLFTPILEGKESAYHRSSSLETIIIKAHGTLFTGRPFDDFNAMVRQIKNGLLDSYIGRVTAKFLEQGVFVAVASIAALFEYGSLRESGSPKSVFRLAFDEVRVARLQISKIVAQRSHDGSSDTNSDAPVSFIPSGGVSLQNLTSSQLQSSLALVAHASDLAFAILLIALRRRGDRNVFPLVHVFFVFLWSLAAVEKAMIYVQKDIPWSEICSFLNVLARSDALTSAVRGESFPKPDDDVGRPLPEDFVMRGQIYSQWYFPERWFEDAKVDDEERFLEKSSMAATRVERILWLGLRMASRTQWITFDEKLRTFSVTQVATEFLDDSRDLYAADVDAANVETIPALKDEDSIMSEVVSAEEEIDNASLENPSRSPTTSPFDETQPTKATFPKVTKADTIMAEVGAEKLQPADSSTGSPTSNAIKRPKFRLSQEIPAKKDYGGHKERLSLSHDMIHTYDAYESDEPYKT